MKELDYTIIAFGIMTPAVGGYISQDPIGMAGGNPTLYGYVSDSNSWVDVFGLDCSKSQGTATIHKYDGDVNNPFGHYSIEVNHNGKISHTHQVITSRDFSTTTIVPAKGISPSKSITIAVPNAEAATIYQKRSIGKELGAYDAKINSCVDHVSEVLRSSGVEVPKSALGQYRYLKEIGLKIWHIL